MIGLIRRFCLFLLCLAACVSSQDPCDGAIDFVVGKERDPSYFSNASRIKACDTLPNAWYRIRGPGEIYLDLTNTPPAIDRCDTTNPIWMRGDVPTGGAQVTNQLCVVSSSSDCLDQRELRVKDCGNFRVYNLFAPRSCPSAYCIEFPKPPQTTTAANCPGSIASIDMIPIVEPFVVESDDPELGPEDGRTFEELRFRCRLKTLEPTWFYDVLWHINGLSLAFQPTQVAGSEYVQTNLKERHWRDNFKMGMKVNCSVAARLRPNCARGPVKSSTEFFAGIKVSPTEIFKRETDTSRSEITYTSTVPISCRVRSRGDTCELVFSSSNQNDAYNCPVTLIGIGVVGGCQLRFDSSNWNNPRRHIVNSEYSQDFDNHVFVISMNSQGRWPGSQPDIWRDVILPSVTVTYIDEDRALQGTICKMRNDPYVFPFDEGWRSYTTNLQGEFVMFRHKNLPIAVHVLQENCLGGVATCVCGIAVQAGLDVFTWVGCTAVRNIYKQFRMRPYGCFKSGIKVEELNDGKKYIVHTQNGIKVTMDLETFRTLMQVNIEVPPDSKGLAEGLCGDLGVGGRSTIGDPVQWRANNSLFGGPINEGRRFDIAFCTCDLNGEMVCNDHRMVTPKCSLPGNDVTERFTYACGQKRDLILQDLDDEWPDFGFNISYVPPPSVWKNGWNQQSAEDYCVTFYKNSEVYKRCSGIDGLNMEGSIAMCVDMIHITGEDRWTSQTLDAYKSDCLFEVTRNSSYWVSSPGQISVFESTLELMCPDDCNGHGTCNKGVCQCDSSYLGAGCGVNIFESPKELVLPNKGMCDLSQKLCRGVLVIGSQFINMDGFGCRLRTIQVSSAGVIDTSQMVECKASYHSRYEALVIIDQFDDFDGLVDVEEPTAIGYKLALMNNGTGYSDDVIFLPHDATCLQCKVDGTKASCEIKEGYCSINYQCVRSGASQVGDSCSVCDPSSSTVKWTKSGCTRELTKRYSIPIWIPIVASVSAVCLVFTIVAVIVLCRRKRMASKVARK